MPKDAEMGLIDHLDELRIRILIALAAVVTIAVVAYVFKDVLLAFIAAPLARYYNMPTSQIPAILDGLRQVFKDSGHFTPEQLSALNVLFERQLRQLTSLTFIHPTEAFVSYIKLSLYAGVLVGSPIVLFQVWRFILPALYDKERRYFMGAFTVGSVLFYLGVAFSFYVVFPFVIRFLINLGSASLYASLTIGNYISFSMMFLLVFGLVFELPVLVFLAVRTGLTSIEFLKQKRRYLYVIAFAGAAIITPPDVISQLAVGVPVVVLFELSLWFSALTERRRKRNVESAEEDDGEGDDGDV